jgi:peptidoglycan/xylan/chitin deacetylase (PgdA/CDA1 family)
MMPDRKRRLLRRPLAARESVPVRARFEPVVLCYHAVSERWEHVLAVSPKSIESQVRLLLRLGYRAVPAADVVSGRGRVLHVTFDDAFHSVLEAVPILERLGAPATVFACSALADGGQPFPIQRPADRGETSAADLRTLDWDGLRQLADRGVEIGSHAVSHPRLIGLADGELDRELRESRERLEGELQRPCRFLAYPYGDHDERVRAAAGRAGYEAAFGLPGKAKPFDRFGLPRIGIYRKDRLWRFALKTFARRPVGAVARWR